MFLKIVQIMVITIFCHLILSCSAKNDNFVNNVIVMSYQDFGPQDIAAELIGPNYWQWDSGHYRRPQKFDIKVIVYRKVSLDVVKAMFPVDESNKQDFRYVQYQAAVKWYDKQIANFNADLASNSGDINIAFYFLRDMHVNLLKIERALRK